MRNGVVALGLSILGALTLGLLSVGCSGGDATVLPPPPPPTREYCLNGLAYIDADGDGFGANDDTGVDCQNGLPPDGYAVVAGDCDDSDSAAYRRYIRDADGDGFGSRDDVSCAGDLPPAGYVSEYSLVDCDDTDPELNTWYYADIDGDGYAGAAATKICGPKDSPPPNSVSQLDSPGDCNDSDPTVRTLYYEDADGDGWAASDVVSICGSPSAPPEGYGIYRVSSHDCDDTRADVSPVALELWDDNIDSDCSGTPTPNECPTEICGPGANSVPIDTTCATFDLVVTNAYANPRCFEIEWYVTIANQGNELASGHKLWIEVDGRSLVSSPLDALQPGQAYTYRLNDRWYVAGAVRFTVVSPVADCRPDNDTLEVVGNTLDCSL